MRRCGIKLTKVEADAADAAGFWATAQYARHLILALKNNYKQEPDIDSQNGLYAGYYFLKQIFADTAVKAKELKLPALAKCFNPFKDMPEASVMEESLGMADPKIPQAEMVEILQTALSKAMKQCYLAIFAIDMGRGLLYDDETQIIRCVADAAGVPPENISLKTRIKDLALGLFGPGRLVKSMAEYYNYEEDFIELDGTETVEEIVDMVFGIENK